MSKNIALKSQLLAIISSLVSDYILTESDLERNFLEQKIGFIVKIYISIYNSYEYEDGRN